MTPHFTQSKSLCPYSSLHGSTRSAPPPHSIITFLISYPIILLDESATALLVLDTSHIPELGPLRWHFPLPGTHFPQVFAVLTP